MSDYYNIIDTAVEAAEKRGMQKGMEKGREEGIAAGMEKGKFDAARKMLAAGFDAKAVADALGIDVDSILE